MVKIARLDVAFPEIFELGANPVECQSQPQKDKTTKKERPRDKLKDRKA